MIFRKGELFCGPGGLALAAKRAKAISHSGEEFKTQHIWANDLDESSCRTFQHNICPDNPESIICENVRELNIESLPPIDAFTFGFPCNDYSNVGEKKGINGEYGPLYTYGVKVLNYHKPMWFLAENVGGLQSADSGETFIKILNDLSNAGPGYNVVPHLYKFEEYGVPQTRHRIIIVGIRRDLGLTFNVPATTTANNFKTSKSALEHPPISQNAYNNELTKHPQRIIDRLNVIPQGQNAWYEGIPEHLRLNVKGAKLSNIYKRLHPDLPAYTVTGSGGGGTHMYHYAEPRALTNRERARLQTFPDDFVFMGGKEDVRRQIGMAVPPDGAQIIIEAILKTFAGIEYEHIAPHWNIEDLT